MPGIAHLGELTSDVKHIQWRFSSRIHGDAMGVKYGYMDLNGFKWDIPQWEARCNTLGQDRSAAARLLRRAPGLTAADIDRYGRCGRYMGCPGCIWMYYVFSFGHCVIVSR